MSGKVGVHGVSEVAEFELSAATRISGLSVGAAIVPSHVDWEGWGPGTQGGKSSVSAWRGEPLPFCAV